MAEYSASPFTLTTPGGTITFNAASGSTYRLAPRRCRGLDGAPLRASADDAPMSDGGIVHAAFKGARRIVLGGDLLVRGAANDAAYVAARSTLEDNLRIALESIERADGTLSWTPSGGARSLTVRYEIAVEYPGDMFKEFTFGLIAADPTW